MLKHETSSWTMNVMQAGEDAVAQIAELLGLPVEVIRAYCEPRRGVALQAPPKKINDVIEVEPYPARLMTLKQTLVFLRRRK
jgi:hypothetical protein